MTPKKVWGTIIIVVGIFMIFNGATKVYEADFFLNEVKSTESYLSQVGGSQFYDSKRYQQLIENEKNNGVGGILLGILAAIGGTLLIGDRKHKKNAQIITPQSCSTKTDIKTNSADRQLEPAVEVESKSWNPQEIEINKGL